MPTHGQVVRGTGGTAAATRSQVGGNITLPAGGPWIIHGIWAHIAQATAVADESLDGSIQIDAVSGDLTPDPAPGRYPLGAISAPVSADYGHASMPLNIWDVNWSAPGKSVIALYHIPSNALAVAPQMAAGILYSEAIPDKQPLVFCDRMQADFSSTAEQAIGTITLSEKVSTIVGVCATIANTAAPAVDIPVIGTFRLQSDDVDIRPFEGPFNQALSPGDGTVAGAPSIGKTEFITVNIPVPGGARVDGFATTNEAVTNSASVQIYIAAI